LTASLGVSSVDVHSSERSSADVTGESGTSSSGPASADGSSKSRATKRAATPRPSAAKKDWSITKGLNFAPTGKQSLKDFTEQKKPKNQNERNVIACYYLSKVMEHAPITVGDVLAVYQALNWPKPSNPSNALHVTASTLGWLDTKDTNNIKVIWAGSNHVEDGMPAKRD
jgi:hypothetical protein